MFRHFIDCGNNFRLYLCFESGVYFLRSAFVEVVGVVHTVLSAAGLGWADHRARRPSQAGLDWLAAGQTLWPGWAGLAWTAGRD